MKVKICAKCGCNRAAEEGKRYCDKHSAMEGQYFKGKKRKPFEGAERAGNYHSSKWIALRKKVREEFPYCRYCGSTERLEVHHVVPVRYAPEKMFDESNLIVVCSSCHKMITRREIEERRRGDR